MRFNQMIQLLFVHDCLKIKVLAIHIVYSNYALIICMFLFHRVDPPQSGVDTIKHHCCWLRTDLQLNAGHVIGSETQQKQKIFGLCGRDWMFHFSNIALISFFDFFLPMFMFTMCESDSHHTSWRVFSSASYFCQDLVRTDQSKCWFVILPIMTFLSSAARTKIAATCQRSTFTVGRKLSGRRPEDAEHEPSLEKKIPQQDAETRPARNSTFVRGVWKEQRSVWRKLTDERGGAAIVSHAGGRWQTLTDAEHKTISECCPQPAAKNLTFHPANVNVIQWPS